MGVILTNEHSFIEREAVVRVLVTGAFGNVGRSTLAALFQKGFDVTALEADTPRNRRIAPRLALELGRKGRPAFSSLVLGDVRDRALAARAVTGQDAIIHLAALILPAADRQPELADFAHSARGRRKNEFGGNWFARRCGNVGSFHCF